MAVSDAILSRLLKLHPKIIDLELTRMERVLEALDYPEKKLPPIIHVAGTNGKGSVIATLRAIMEAAGLQVHSYTSPHLVRFHERIRLGGEGGSAPIPEDTLIELLERCEEANGDLPITFFEVTTAAAFLAFSTVPADYLLLEVGLGGRLDATNVIDKPAVSVITAIDLDHQQFLGDSLEKIAFEKAGILKRSAPAVVSRQHREVWQVIERQAQSKAVPLLTQDQDWQAYEQHGRIIFEDQTQLLDLPLSNLVGRFQTTNAGTAVAAIQALADPRISTAHIEQGLTQVEWPARMQRLKNGALAEKFGAKADIWLDGGHNPAAGKAVSETLADLNDHCPKSLIMVLGMLNTKDPKAYLDHFAGLASEIIALSIPEEENSVSPGAIIACAHALGINASSADDLEHALNKADGLAGGSARLFIGGSLYLAGHVLALDRGVSASAISGISRK